jgi:hypothetical protein
MVDGLFEGNTLLNEVDGMVRNAIKCQVVSTTIQHSCYVLLDTAFTCQTTMQAVSRVHAWLL